MCVVWCVGARKQFDEDRIVSGSYDKTIRVWDLDKFREGKKPTTISKLVGHREFVGTLRIDSKNVVRHQPLTSPRGPRSIHSMLSSITPMLARR